MLQGSSFSQDGGSFSFINNGVLGSAGLAGVSRFSMSYGDGSGAGVGSVSFTNTSGGTIFQPVVVSNSGGTTTFSNAGTIGVRGPVSAAPLLTIGGTGDGAGASAGNISFANTGVIYQPVLLSNSGGSATITNSGTLGVNTAVSAAPIFTIGSTGDGSGAGSGNISFTNTSGGIIWQPISIAASGANISITNAAGGALVQAPADSPAARRFSRSVAPATARAVPRG